MVPSWSVRRPALSALIATQLGTVGAVALSGPAHAAGDTPIDKARCSSGRTARTAMRSAAKYPIEDLSESLAEGIISGHPDMPVFVFKPDDVEAIIEYLKSIQAQ
jgi:hypothetical protein